MRTTRRLSVLAGAALATAAMSALAVPAHADSNTVTHCSNWKLSGTRYLQACIDVTGTQVHTYGYVSSAGNTAPGDVIAALTGQLNSGGQVLGIQAGNVHVDNNTVLVDGATTTAPAGTSVRATLFLPGVIGTGTLYAPDGAVYVDPTVPPGPAGPDGRPAVIQQITVWSSVSG